MKSRNFSPLSRFTKIFAGNRQYPVPWCWSVATKVRLMVLCELCTVASDVASGENQIACSPTGKHLIKLFVFNFCFLIIWECLICFRQIKKTHVLQTNRKSWYTEKTVFKWRLLCFQVFRNSRAVSALVVFTELRSCCPSEWAMCLYYVRYPYL